MMEAGTKIKFGTTIQPGYYACIDCENSFRISEPKEFMSCKKCSSNEWKYVG